MKKIKFPILLLITLAALTPATKAIFGDGTCQLCTGTDTCEQTNYQWVSPTDGSYATCAESFGGCQDEY